MISLDRTPQGTFTQPACASNMQSSESAKLTKRDNGSISAAKATSATINDLFLVMEISYGLNAHLNLLMR